MEIIQGTTEIQFDFPTAVTLGKFDGLHCGHQKLIRALREQKSSGQKLVVFTFDIPPMMHLERQISPVLTTREEKRRLMAAMGVDILIEYPFTEAVRQMNAQDFVHGILVGQLGMKTMAVGPDCGFGYQRSGDVALLEKLSDQLGYHFSVVEKEITRKDNRVISSSRVKKELIRGDIEEANRLLGYLYSINGPRIHEGGHRITAELFKVGESWVIGQGGSEYKLMLPEGNYFSKVWFGENCFKSITKILRISEKKGQMITELRDPILAKNGCFTPEISLIAQIK